tara:strand:+ start:4383 stop:6182 length:1800 start_codon:yes stop_codon:yes gene_type:complete
MKINHKIISDKELYEKSIDVVEFLANAKIRLQIFRGDNWCTFQGIDKQDSKNLYTINLSSSRNPAIPRYTALIHELGHILYETPFTPIKKLLKQWDPEAYWKDTSHAVNLYHQIFNVLEDQRIESQISKSYLGHKKRFEATRYNLGQAGFGDYSDFENPAFALLAIRFMRDDLVKNTKYYHIYKQALDNVEETDRFGGLRVLISIKYCIDEYLRNNKKSQSGITTKVDGHKIPVTQEEKDNWEKHTTEEIRNDPISHTLANHVIKDVMKKLPKPDKNMKRDSPDFSLPPELKKLNQSEKEIKELLQNGKKQGEKQHQEIREKLISRYRPDNTPSNVRKISRLSNNYSIDHKTAKAMNKVFKLLKLRSKSVIDSSGSQIDIEEYIENFSKGTNLNRCYENSKPDYGVSIVISIDASSSMRSDKKIIIARNLVATLFESIKGIKNTEIRGNIWSSDTSGEIGITEINNIKDAKKISVVPHYYLTPLHMGLEYSTKMLKEMKGAKKLLILITDGYPNYSKNDSNIPQSIYNKQCKKSLQKVLKITPNVICFLVGQEDYGINQIMTGIFTSKRFITVPTMEKASQNIVKKFRHFIGKNVQNPF